MAGAKLLPGKSLREAAVGVDGWMVYIGCMRDVHLWHKAELSYLPSAASLRAKQILWGSLASCAPVAYRRSRRGANPPQAASLPHTDGGPMRLRCSMLTSPCPF